MVDDALRWNFRIADEKPTFSAHDDKVYREVGGEYLDFLVGDLLMVKEDVAKAVLNEMRTGAGRSAGGEYDYSDEELKLEVLEPSGRWYSARWDDFVLKVKHKHRYMVPELLEELRGILFGVEDFRAATGERPIRTLEPGGQDSVFYRARQVDDDKLRLAICLDPGRNLGPPPAKYSTAGRLNSQGIPVFYGAFDALTCISEVRSQVGGIVAVGQFKLVRPATVLDLTILEEESEHISYFDRNRYEILSHREFLADFHREVSRPVLSQDEPLDYVPTQMVAEFLANHFDPRIDAVIYRSAMTSPRGLNIAFFPHAASVADSEHSGNNSEGRAEYSATLDGTLYVIERLNPQRDLPDERSAESELLPFALPPEGRMTSDEGPAEPFLRYVEGSLELHRVASIRHSTSLITVIRSDID